MGIKESKYVLTAEDRTRAAFASLERNFNQTERSINQLKSVLGTLGIGFGIGYFGSLIKGSIDAMDRLNDLNKTTGISVETLAGLTVAAKQSGGDLESIAASINKLAVNMGKEPQRFRALGLAAKDPLEAFKQLADVYVRLQEPQQRAAVMAEALGKAWAGAAPLLSEGSRKIGEIVERGTRLSGLTPEMARAADELNDKWVLLGGTGGFLARMVGPMLPLLNTMADEMLKLQENVLETTSSLNPFVEILRALIISGSEFAFIWRQIGISIVGVREQIKGFELGGIKGFLEARKMMTDILEAERKAVVEFEKKIIAAGKSPRNIIAPPVITAAEAAAAAERARKFLGQKRSDLPQINRNLLGIGEDFFAKAQLGQRFGEADLTKQIEQVTRANEVMRMKAEGEAFGAEQLRIYKDAQHDASASVEVYIKSIANETRLMGATTTGRQRLIDLMRLEDEQRDLVAKGTGFTAAEYERLRQKIEELRDAQERLNESWAFGAQNALAQYVETVRNVAASTESLVTNAFRGMEDALLQFVKTGKLNFNDLANSIMADMIRIQIQQSITGPLAQIFTGLFPPINAGGTTTVGPTQAFGGQNIQMRAWGGPVDAWSPYWVGEQGPELVVPRVSGTVIPNDRAAGGGNVTINQSIKVDSRSDQGSILQAMFIAKAQMLREIRATIRGGGKL